MYKYVKWPYNNVIQIISYFNNLLRDSVYFNISNIFATFLQRPEMVKRVGEAKFNLTDKSQPWFKSILLYEYDFLEIMAKPEEILAFLDF